MDKKVNINNKNNNNNNKNNTENHTITKEHSHDMGMS
jgi:hypothetical protein